MNPINFYLYAKQAAGGYIGSNGDLNDAIAKIACRENLSQVQIQRVVELTNHEVNDQLRKTADEKTYTFPLASVDGVLAKMQEVPKTAGVSHVKIAETIKAYNKGTGEASIDSRCQEMVKHSGALQTLEKEATLRKEALLQKVAAARTEADARRIGALNKVAEEMRDLVQTAKHFVLTDGGSLDTLKKYASAVVPDWDNGWNALLDTVKNELLKLGHPFTSSRLASQLDFSKDRDRVNPIAGPTVKVVNGKTALALQLKQVHASVTEAVRQTDKLREIDNFKDVLEHAPTVFKDNAQAQKFIDGLYRMDAHTKTDEFGSDVLKKVGKRDDAPSKSERAKAVAGILAGEAGATVSDAVLDSAAKNLVHNYTPAAHQGPIKNIPQYLKGR